MEHANIPTTDLMADENSVPVNIDSGVTGSRSRKVLALEEIVSVIASVNSTTPEPTKKRYSKLLVL